MAGMWCVCMCAAELCGGTLELCVAMCTVCEGRGHSGVGVCLAWGNWWGLSWSSLGQGQGNWASQEELLTISNVLIFSALARQKEASGPQGTVRKGVPIARHHLGLSRQSCCQGLV